MKETKEQFIKRMLDKKADENNIIDLNAYGIGLEEMYEALNLDIVTQQRELFDKFYAWLDGLTQEEYDDMSLTDKCEKYFFKI